MLGFLLYTFGMFNNESIQKPETAEPLHSAQERAPIHETVHEVENRFEGLSWDAELLTRWLKRFHGIDVELYELENDNFFIAVNSLPEAVPSLPEGYGYKGGAARSILEHTLNLPTSSPRDLDLVYVGDTSGENKDLSKQLAEE